MNSSNYKDCASDEEFRELLKQKIYINFVFNNKKINLQDYAQPYIDYMESEVFFLIDPLKYYKQADIFFQKNTISYDDNLWFYQSKNNSKI